MTEGHAHGEATTGPEPGHGTSATSEPGDDVAVQITPEALDTIALEAARSTDGLETGGILLGHDTDSRIIVRHAGDPGPHARRGPHSFLRDLAHAQALAGMAWRLDGSQWIGEWHTHPTAKPSNHPGRPRSSRGPREEESKHPQGRLVPSAIDLDSYLRHLHDPDLRLDRFLTVMVGLEGNGGVSTASWLIYPSHIQPVRLWRTDEQ